MARILFLSQLLPLPLDAGPKIRAYYVLRHLAEAGHEVTLLCFVRPSDKASDVRALGEFCRGVETVPLRRSRSKNLWDGMRSLTSDAPFLILRDRVPAMAERLQRLLDRGSWDAVHADQLWMAPYAAQCPGVPRKVLDQHNAVFRIPEHLAANARNPIVKSLLGREAVKLARFERETLERFDRVVWVTEEDRAAFPTCARSGRHDEVIPIAVDPGTTRPVERRRPFRVTFLGGIHWPPNAEAVRWFADRVWPSVRAAVPDGVFTVIGKGSPGRLRDMSRVEVTGYAQDLEPYLAETAAFVVPLLTGAGMRVKILDAWCWALPVVSTSIGAEGLNAVHGENLLIADEPDAFADHLVRILRDGREASRIARNGRATVEADYDWRKVYRAWDSVYSRGGRPLMHQRKLAVTSASIPFNRPAIVGRELEYISQAIQQGHSSGDGAFSRRCQSVLETALGVPRALLTTSCTDALEMAAVLLDIAPGDEVIVPSFTFVSTVNAFVLRGATPVFADIRPDTLNMDEAQVERLVTPRTKAIVPMHYAGVGCEMEPLGDIAARHGIPIVEDNAHGLFSKYRGRYLGTFGTFATQSFHETKNFTCGEGGALLVNDERYVQRAEIVREKGTNRSRFFRGEVDRYTWVDIGSSHLPSDILAAFLLAQLEAREAIQSRRRRTWERYYAELEEWGADHGVRLPVVPAHCDQAFHLFYLLMPSAGSRQDLIRHLKDREVHAVFHYLPLHLSPMGQRFGGAAGQCPVTESVSDRLLRLPFYGDITEQQQTRVIEAVRAFRLP